MRVAVISDTHMPRGDRALPERCVDELRKADAILHGGDWTTPEVIDLIQSFGPPVYGILGNVDGVSMHGLMPPTRVVELEGVRIGMIHDAGSKHGRLQRLREAFPDADAVIFGHSHMPEHQTGADGFQIFNPGSPTERRRAPVKTMGIATIAGGAITFELLALA